MGTLLFERRPRGVRLTSAGELFLDLARRQLSDTERMLSQIEELKGMRRGVVRIAGSQALAHPFLPASLAQFRKQFPLLSFDVPGARPCHGPVPPTSSCRAHPSGLGMPLR